VFFGRCIPVFLLPSRSSTSYLGVPDFFFAIPYPPIFDAAVAAGLHLVAEQSLLAREESSLCSFAVRRRRLGYMLMFRIFAFNLPAQLPLKTIQRIGSLHGATPAGRACVLERIRNQRRNVCK
jgi:hypothetical protein